MEWSCIFYDAMPSKKPPKNPPVTRTFFFTNDTTWKTEDFDTMSYFAMDVDHFHYWQL